MAFQPMAAMAKDQARDVAAPKAEAEVATDGGSHLGSPTHRLLDHMSDTVALLAQLSCSSACSTGTRWYSASIGAQSSTGSRLSNLDTGSHMCPVVSWLPGSFDRALTELESNNLLQDRDNSPRDPNLKYQPRLGDFEIPQQ